MGFNDKEIVALSGAHSLGRCHEDRSGFTGPWTRAPTTFSNEYFRLLLVAVFRFFMPPLRLAHLKATPSNPLFFPHAPPHKLTLQQSSFPIKRLDEKWVEHKPKPTAPAQFQDASSKSLMMLPSDMALLADPVFKKQVIEYSKDGEAFKKDFAQVFAKLLELGVKFEAGSTPLTITFK